MTKVKRALIPCLLAMIAMFVSDHSVLKAGSSGDPYLLPINNVVNLKRLLNYSLEEQTDSMVTLNYSDGSAAPRVAKAVDLIKEPPDAIDNYDIIGLKYHFQDGITVEIFFDKLDEKSQTNR
ncbi:hypothetical protein ES702_03250 [subsurface metagenome]